MFSWLSCRLWCEPWLSCPLSCEPWEAPECEPWLSCPLSDYLFLIGAYGDSFYKGAAYAYSSEPSSTSQLCKWVANDGVLSDRFGQSVAASGSYGLVGAQGVDNQEGANAGSAYIFNLSSGEQLHKLLASDAAPDDKFGSSVAASGNYGLVGAAQHDAQVSIRALGKYGLVGAYGTSNKGADSGSAYIFDLFTGKQLYKLLASDGEPGDEFGISVAASGDYGLVGAWGDDHKGFDSGSVSASGNYGLVGAYQDDDKCSNSGSAYIFDLSTGQQLRKLMASEGFDSDWFGYSVAASGNYGLVGALYHGSSNSGSSYVVDLSTGQQLSTLLPSDASASQFFGTSASIVAGKNGFFFFFFFFVLCHVIGNI
eukprot:g56487.t1